MNIFATSSCPVQSALWLDDIRKNKMILEADLIPAFEDYYHQGEFLSDKQTKHPNCAANQGQGLSFKHIDDVHMAYRLYLNERWKRDTIPLSWVHGQKPEWHYDKMVE